jgi:hypothetical protein
MTNNTDNMTDNQLTIKAYDTIIQTLSSLISEPNTTEKDADYYRSHRQYFLIRKKNYEPKRKP